MIEYDRSLFRSPYNAAMHDAEERAEKLGYQILPLLPMDLGLPGDFDRFVEAAKGQGCKVTIGPSDDAGDFLFTVMNAVAIHVRIK